MGFGQGFLEIKAVSRGIALLMSCLLVFTLLTAGDAPAAVSDSKHAKM